MLGQQAGTTVLTKLDIDDDALALAQGEADRRDVSLGEAISLLIRYALATPPRFVTNPLTGLPVLPRRPGGTTVTLEMVNALRDEQDEAYVQEMVRLRDATANPLNDRRN